MTRRRLFLRAHELEALLTERSLNARDLRPELRAQVCALAVGGVALVHDPLGRGTLRPGERLPLMVAAMRCGDGSGGGGGADGSGGGGGGGGAQLQLLVKKADAPSLLHRLRSEATLASCTTFGPGAGPEPSAAEPSAAPGSFIGGGKLASLVSTGGLALEEPQEPPPLRSRASSEAIEVLTPDVDAVATVAAPAAADEAQAGAPAKDEGVPLCYKPSCVVS